ncbi:glycoside hydrolase family 3 protein [Hysterangium stoloniferum]|nr:glycoside hydrolase family 3 protein [Hysterangium stoloniferum]
MTLLPLSSIIYALGLISVSSSFVTRSWSESVQLADQLVSSLTLGEKVGILTGQGIFTAHCIGNTHAVNRSLPNAPNGVPSICLNDGPSGVRAVDLVTGFPTGINAASTFSRRLIQARGQAMAEEFRAKGINVLLGPAMDLMRSPKAGRGWESFGPDPWLSGEAAFSTIQGIQSVGVQACAKHFLANVQEHYRYTYSVTIDDRTIHEMYLWPFIRAVEANVSSVMCAYNQFNGTYSCGNSGLLGPTGLLKQIGFQGYVMSDWGATHPTTSQYANAGLDMEQPGDFILVGGGVFGDFLEAAVVIKDVAQSRLDQMVSNILAPWFRLGQDTDYPPPNFDALKPDGSGPLNLHVNARSDAHTALAREIAGASSVLLKNNGALPLKGAEKTMAVIGLDSIAPEKGCTLDGCDGGTVVTGWGSGSIILDFVVPPIDAIQAFVASNATGTAITTSPSNDLDKAAQAAIGKEVALVFVNAMSGEFQLVNGNLGDRADLDLWFKGGSMIERVAAVNPNTIVVIHSTGPVLMGPWSDSPNVTAIIYAGVPGEQTGPAIVDVLYGKVNPSGRLPFTIAVNANDYPADILYFDLNPAPTIKFQETLFIDYRHFDQAGISPRYEFGFGLSYTTFAYSALSVTPSGTGATISFSVKNMGERDGTEIPQLYIGFPAGVGEPPKVLRGFDEVPLRSGASKSVTFSLNERDLSVWDTPSKRWTRPSGTFTVYVGASSRNIHLQGSL